MPDFSVRSDSVNVEQIMEQIRARIREKRGVDYTEQQIHELAKVKLEKFLDPRGLRSDLLEQFRRRQPPAPADTPSLVFEDTTMFETHRGFLRFMRRLLNPILKLFFNPNALIHALHTQAQINRAMQERDAARELQRRDLDGLYFEVIHNLVLELTRAGIEVKNLKMRVESLASRVEFNERRARALESAVVYREGGDRPRQESGERPRHESERAPSPPDRVVPQASPQPSAPSPQMPPPAGEGPGQRSRRRRRRRGRRSGPPAAVLMGGGEGAPPQAPAPTTEAAPVENMEHAASGESAAPGPAAPSAPPAPPPTGDAE